MPVTSHGYPARSRDTEARVEAELDELAAAAAGAASPRVRTRLHQDMVVLALPLADGIARRYVGRGIETDDLIQVARTGLVKAVRRYRPSRGSAFAAYATPTISGELKRWFRDQGWSVRPPRRVQELRARVAVEEERQQRLLARQPTEEEIAAGVGIGVSELAEVRLCTMGYRSVSLDAPIDSDRSMASRLLVVGSRTEEWDNSEALGQAIAALTDRQRLILRLRFADDFTQSQIAEQIGVSQMQVSRLLRALLDQLRAELQVTLGAGDTLAG